MYTSMNIKMKNPAGKDIAKSVTYVSASASSADLKSMAQGLVGLTQNTYDGADRIQKLNVDTEQVPQTEPARLTPAFTVTKNQIDIPKNPSILFAYNGNGSIAVAATGQDTWGDDTVVYTGLKLATGTGNNTICVACILDAGQPAQSVGSYEVTITASQTDEYEGISTVLSASGQ